MRKRPKKIQTELIDDISLEHHKKKLRYYKQRRRFHKFRMYVMTTRFLARIIVFCLILFGLVKVLNLPQWYLKSDVFTNYPNSSIEIEGNKIVSTSQIINVLKPVKLPQKPIYLLDTKIIEKSILTLNPIKNVYIRRFWFPARLRIIVDEKIPILEISTVPKIPSCFSIYG